MLARGITEKDFAKNHPSGQLGRNLLLTVGDVMHPLQRTAVVRQDASLKEVVIAMTQYPLGAALVMNDQDKLHGIVTDGDLRRALAGVDDIRELHAERLMTTNPVCIDPGALLQVAIEMMEARSSQIAVLPVAEQGTEILLGLLRLHDVYQPVQSWS